MFRRSTAQTVECDAGAEPLRDPNARREIATVERTEGSRPIVAGALGALLAAVAWFPGPVTAQSLDETDEVVFEIPAPVILAGPSALTSKPSAVFRFTGSGGSSFECSIDGRGFESCGSPVTYRRVGDGEHTFEVRTLDELGNASPNSSSSWAVDTRPPVVSLQAAPDYVTNPRDAAFIISADDPGGSGVASIQCSLDLRGFSRCGDGSQATVLLRQLRSGPHTFRTRARDEAGNIGRAVQHSFRITAPKPPTPVIPAGNLLHSPGGPVPTPEPQLAQFPQSPSVVSGAQSPAVVPAVHPTPAPVAPMPAPTSQTLVATGGGGAKQATSLCAAGVFAAVFSPSAAPAAFVTCLETKIRARLAEEADALLNTAIGKTEEWLKKQWKKLVDRKERHATKEGRRAADMESQRGNIEAIGAFWTQGLAQAGYPDRDLQEFAAFVDEQLQIYEGGAADFSVGAITAHLDQPDSIVYAGSRILLRQLKRTNPGLMSLEDVPGFRSLYVGFLFDHLRIECGSGRTCPVTDINHFGGYIDLAGLSRRR